MQTLLEVCRDYSLCREVRRLLVRRWKQHKRGLTSLRVSPNPWETKGLSSEPGFINMEAARRRAPWCQTLNPCYF